MCGWITNVLYTIDLLSVQEANIDLSTDINTYLSYIVHTNVGLVLFNFKFIPFGYLQ